ncbi:SMI1/KNR4 family protein [Priestia flexa]|uniref:SMI1/KNR4 family protein n=1 Tax=Priestia flexa TaxID=86664 RepID=UPI000BA06F11|nr:hypothetical protein CHN50_18425 [Priestia aryabhattai]
MFNLDIEEILDKLEEVRCKETNIKYRNINGEIQVASLYLFSKGEFTEGQLGYREDENGNSLIKNIEGYWKDSWFVIGYDEEVGDPIFIDISNKDVPVLVAEHGMDEWEPFVLYNSFENFIKDIQ